jgi:TRAP-type mannitol/chloroaromatic compound transport system permease small subunit
MHQEHMRIQYLYKSLAMRTKQLQTLLEMHILLTQGSTPFASTRISYNRLHISDTSLQCVYALFWNLRLLSIS